MGCNTPPAVTPSQREDVGTADVDSELLATDWPNTVSALGAETDRLNKVSACWAETGLPAMVSETGAETDSPAKVLER